MKLVLKNKAAGQTALLRHAHERSRMWIDHLFCNEQSSHTRSDIFCFVVTHPSMAEAKNSPSPEILYPEWQNEYQVALLELDRKKLLERVKAAETAIFNRLQAISHSSDAHAERQAIEDALASLRVLKRDNLGNAEARQSIFDGLPFSMGV